MTDEGYQVDLEHLDTVTAKIAGLHAFVQDSLEGVDTRVAAAHQSWTGEAATTHAEVHRQWREAAEEARKGIAAMQAAAAAAHSQYSDALATNLRILRSGGR
ncbi:WXG100 family type VII secretion target [Nocardia sp. NPDC051570]|uniref:WXG100 family type VII secretion target n=1 Tax=Nocardia sp. NPDC051570 TaxID=3364324 RepID=UPI0037BC3884